MNRTLQRLLAIAATGLLLGGTLGAGTALAVAPPTPDPAVASAGADRCAPLRLAARTQPTVANLRAAGLCEIERSLGTLAKLQSVVDAATVLTDAHEAALDAILSSTGSGLRALRTEIEGDSTVASLREDIRRIATDFRVRVLIARQVALVKAADAAAAAGVRLATAADRLETAISQAEANGKDVGDAGTHLATMSAALGRAGSAVDGVAPAVLALTPAAWNAGDAAPVLRDARESVREARVALREATAAARAVRAHLR